MSFLNPGLLFGLLALAVPLIVLLLFRKKIVLNWAAYEWMARATRKKHKQTLRDDLLKLLAKLLLLLTMVLLMARPAIRNEGGGGTLLVIDATPSMGFLLDGGTRLQRARELAAAYLETSAGSTAVAVYDGDLEFLSPLTDSTDPRVVEGAELTGNTGTFEQFIQRLLALDTLHRTPRILFYTDAQRSDFADVPGLRRILESLAPNQLTILPVDDREDAPNVGIIDFLPSAEGYFPGRSSVVSVKVWNFSNQPAQGVTVEAKVDGLVQDRTGLDLPPNSGQRVDLLVALQPGAASEITVELPMDPYSTDNVWLAVVTPPPRVRVLSVSPAFGDDPFEYDVFFESALRAFIPEEYLVYQRVRPHQLLSLDLNHYDVVVAFGVPMTEGSALTTPLLEYVREGGALLAFADAERGTSFEVFEVETSDPHEGTLVPDPERLADGILDFMAEPGMNPAALRFLKSRSLLHGEADSVLYLDTVEDPLVLSLPFGEGQVVMAGFLPYVGHTDMIYNPNFVQVAMRLVMEAWDAPTLVSIVGADIARMAFPDLMENRSYTLQLGDEAARTLDLRIPEEGRAYLSGDPIPENRFGMIHRDGEPWMPIAYNVSRADSDTHPIPAAEIQSFFSELEHVQAGGGASLGPIRFEFRALMALLLFLVILFDTYAHLWRSTR